MTDITLKMLHRATAKLKRLAVAPLTIKTEVEARRISKTDPLHRCWKKGEKYYWVKTVIEL